MTRPTSDAGRMECSPYPRSALPRLTCAGIGRQLEQREDEKGVLPVLGVIMAGYAVAGCGAECCLHIPRAAGRGGTASQWNL